ncbi:unnamed protein product, partial [Symbiodinium sp. KB8]
EDTASPSSADSPSPTHASESEGDRPPEPAELPNLVIADPTGGQQATLRRYFRCSVDDLNKLVNVKAPPVSVVILTAAVTTILTPGVDVPTDMAWSVLRQQLANVATLASRLKRFDPRYASPFKWKALQPFFVKGTLLHSSIWRSSRAADGILMWLLEMISLRKDAEMLYSPEIVSKITQCLASRREQLKKRLKAEREALAEANVARDKEQRQRRVQQAKEDEADNRSPGLEFELTHDGLEGLQGTPKKHAAGTKKSKLKSKKSAAELTHAMKGSDRMPGSPVRSQKQSLQNRKKKGKKSLRARGYVSPDVAPHWGPQLAAASSATVTKVTSQRSLLGVDIPVVVLLTPDAVVFRCPDPVDVSLPALRLVLTPHDAMMALGHDPDTYNAAVRTSLNAQPLQQDLLRSLPRDLVLVGEALLSTEDHCLPAEALDAVGLGTAIQHLSEIQDEVLLQLAAQLIVREVDASEGAKATQKASQLLAESAEDSEGQVKKEEEEEDGEAVPLPPPVKRTEEVGSRRQLLLFGRKGNKVWGNIDGTAAEAGGTEKGPDAGTSSEESLSSSSPEPPHSLASQFTRLGNDASQVAWGRPDAAGSAYVDVTDIGYDRNWVQAACDVAHLHGIPYFLSVLYPAALFKDGPVPLNDAPLSLLCRAYDARESLELQCSLDVTEVQGMLEELAQRGKLGISPSTSSSDFLMNPAHLRFLASRLLPRLTLSEEHQLILGPPQATPPGSPRSGAGECLSTTGSFKTVRRLPPALGRARVLLSLRAADGPTTSIGRALQADLTKDEAPRRLRGGEWFQVDVFHPATQAVATQRLQVPVLHVACDSSVCPTLYHQLETLAEYLALLPPSPPDTTAATGGEEATAPFVTVVMTNVPRLASVSSETEAALFSRTFYTKAGKVTVQLSASSYLPAMDPNAAPSDRERGVSSGYELKYSVEPQTEDADGAAAGATVEKTLFCHDEDIWNLYRTTKEGSAAVAACKARAEALYKHFEQPTALSQTVLEQELRPAALVSFLCHLGVVEEELRYLPQGPTAGGPLLMRCVAVIGGQRFLAAVRHRPGVRLSQDGTADIVASSEVKVEEGASTLLTGLKSQLLHAVHAEELDVLLFNPSSKATHHLTTSWNEVRRYLGKPASTDAAESTEDLKRWLSSIREEDGTLQPPTLPQQEDASEEHEVDADGIIKLWHGSVLVAPLNVHSFVSLTSHVDNPTTIIAEVWDEDMKGKWRLELSMSVPLKDSKPDIPVEGLRDIAQHLVLARNEGTDGKEPLTPMNSTLSLRTNESTRSQNIDQWLDADAGDKEASVAPGDNKTQEVPSDENAHSEPNNTRSGETENAAAPTADADNGEAQPSNAAGDGNDRQSGDN